MLLQSVFERHLERYIDDLYLESNHDVLINGLTAGRVALDNVVLKKASIIDSFNFPFKIIFGQVGTLLLYNSNGIQLVLKDLVLLLNMFDHFTSMPTHRTSCFQDFDRPNLELLLTDLLVSLPRYIQDELPSHIGIQIYNMEVRIQDELTSLPRPCTLGFTLSSLVTTIPELLGNIYESKMHFTTEGFGVYVDEASPGDTDTDASSYFANHKYIMEPTNLTVEVVSGLGMGHSPLVNINLFSSNIHTRFTHPQYQYLISLLERYCSHIQKRRYHLFRPEQIKEGMSQSRLWAAAMTILNFYREKRRHYSFPYIKAFGTRRRKYMMLFKRVLSTEITAEELTSLHQLERSMSLSYICLIRHLAVLELQHLSFGQTGGNTRMLPIPNDHHGLEHAIHMRVVARANSICSTFCIPMPNPQCLSEFACKVVLDRPITDIKHDADGAGFTFSSDSFQIIDESLKSSGYFDLLKLDRIQNWPTDTDRRLTAPDSNSACLAMHVSRNIGANRPSGNVEAFCGSAHVVYDRCRLEAAFEFFKGPDRQISFLEMFFGVFFNGQLLVGNTAWRIRLNVDALSFILPENVASMDGELLAIDTRNVTFVGHYMALTALTGRLEKEDSRAYDILSLCLKNIYVRLCHGMNEYVQSFTSADLIKAVTILQDVSIDFLLEVLKDRNLYSSGLPLFKISTKLPKLYLAFSDTKYKLLARLIRQAIPHFENKGKDLDPPGHYDIIPLDFLSLNDSDSTMLENPRESTRVEVGHDTVDVTISDLASDSPINAIGKPFLAFDFEVNELKVALSKSEEAGEERLCNMLISDFHFKCFVQTGKMMIDTKFGTVEVDIPGETGIPISLLPAEGQSNQELMSISFISVKPSHPDFFSIHQGYGQDARISLAPSVFEGPLEPILAIWSFLMTTLAPENNEPTDAQDDASPGDVRLIAITPNRMRVELNLTKVQVLLDLDPEKRGQGRYTKLYTLADKG